MTAGSLQASTLPFRRGSGGQIAGYGLATVRRERASEATAGRVAEALELR